MDHTSNNTSPWRVRTSAIIGNGVTTHVIEDRSGRMVAKVWDYGRESDQANLLAILAAPDLNTQRK